jgi:hypothetical protein
MPTKHTEDLDQIWAEEMERLNRLLAKRPETKDKAYPAWVEVVVAKEVKLFLQLIFLSN